MYWNGSVFPMCRVGANVWGGDPQELHREGKRGCRGLGLDLNLRHNSIPIIEPGRRDALPLNGTRDNGALLALYRDAGLGHGAPAALHALALAHAHIRRHTRHQPIPGIIDARIGNFTRLKHPIGVAGRARGLRSAGGRTESTQPHKGNGNSSKKMS